MSEKVLLFKVSDEENTAVLGITEDTLQRISKMVEMIRESKEILINKATRIRYNVESPVLFGWNVSEDFLTTFDPGTDMKSIPLNFPGFKAISKDCKKNKILFADESTVREEKYFNVINIKTFSGPLTKPYIDYFGNFCAMIDLSYVKGEGSLSRLFFSFRHVRKEEETNYFLSSSLFYTDSIHDLVESCEIWKQAEHSVLPN